MTVIDHVRVPRGTSRISLSHEVLQGIPSDGEWHLLRDCGRTTAYQLARQYNIALGAVSRQPEFEFGAEIDNNSSKLFVRRISQGS
jgi:hypothetical protein